MSTRRLSALISGLVWLCCSVAISGQRATIQSSRHSAKSQTREKSKAELLLDASSGYPVEFQAYVFFRVFSKLSSDIDRRTRLRDLFDAAQNAQLTMPLKGLSPSTDDSATYDEKVSRLGLDIFAIQLHTVELANSTDGRLAVSLFREISYPNFLPQDCSSKSLPDLAQYYRVLSRLYNAVRRRANADDTGVMSDLIYQRVSNVSMLDMPDVVHLLLSTSDDSNWDMWITLFTAKLQTLSADDRSAEFVLDRSDLIENLSLLTNVLRMRGLPVAPTLASYRRLLVSVYEGERCDDNVAFTKGLPKGSFLSPIDSFNALAGSLGDGSKVDLLSHDMSPSKVVPVTTATGFWQSSSTERELFKLLLKLKKSTNPDEDVYALLSSLDQITADSGAANPTMLFHEKCIAYLNLMDVSYDNSDSVKAVESDYLSFLSSSRNTVPNAHWIWEVNRLLGLSRDLSVAVKEFMAQFQKRFGTVYPTPNPFPSGRLARDLTSSRDGALNLMGTLEEEFPTEARQ